MSEVEVSPVSPSLDGEGYAVPSVARHGTISALSVVGGVALLTLGLIAMVLVNWYVGLLIVLGALPLWGWACVQNKTLYS